MPVSTALTCTINRGVESFQLVINGHESDLYDYGCLASLTLPSGERYAAFCEDPDATPEVFLHQPVSHTVEDVQFPDEPEDSELEPEPDLEDADPEDLDSDDEPDDDGEPAEDDDGEPA